MKNPKPVIPQQQQKTSPTPVVVAKPLVAKEPVNQPTTVDNTPMTLEWEFREDMPAWEFDMNVSKFILFKIKDCQRRNIKWEMTFQAVKNVMTAKHCHYTGKKLTHSFKGVTGEYIKRDTDITIDRIDNSKGYEKGNVVACSRFANQLKNEVERQQVFGVADAKRLFDIWMKKNETKSKG